MLHAPAVPGANINIAMASYRLIAAWSWPEFCCPGIELREKDEKITKMHMDLAKSTQAVYEDVFFNLLNILYEKYECKNLSLSGGCAMNSVANGKIIKNTSFKKIYISWKSLILKFRNVCIAQIKMY